MTKATTIYDVAREAHVSMATVSRVVNNSSNVKPDTKKKVMAVIKRLDYHPNAVARGLASSKTTTVGVIIPDITNGYFASLARGIDDIAAMYKYNIILANSDGNTKKEFHVLDTLYSKQVDGILFMGNNITDDLRKLLLSSKTPVVLAGSVDGKRQLPSVNIDYQGAVEQVVSALIERGHHKIALVTDSLTYEINHQFRLKGYQEALIKHHLIFNENNVFETSGHYEDGYQLAKKLQKQGFTAAFSTIDELAVGIENGLMDLNVQIPQSFEIVTSDNTKITEMVRPELSSITQPLYDIGAVAMRLLTKIMDDDLVTNRNVLLPYSVIDRQTTRPSD